MSDTPVHVFDLGDFPLESGVVLPDAKLAYVTYGTLNDARDNAIVFPTWFVGTHADVQWLIGEGKPLDTSLPVGTELSPIGQVHCAVLRRRTHIQTLLRIPGGRKGRIACRCGLQ